MISKSDMCAVFAENLESFFRLSYFITGNEEQAEKCFANALLTASASAAAVANEELRLSRAREVLMKTSLDAISSDLSLSRIALDTSRVEGYLVQASDHAIPSDKDDRSNPGGDNVAQCETAFHVSGSVVLGLPTVVRAAFVLRCLENLSNKETMVLLNLSLNALQKALHVAIVMLNESIKNNSTYLPLAAA